MAENKKTITKYFDQQAAEYHQKHYGTIFKNHSRYPGLLLRHKYIMEMLGDFEGKRAIDVGCGSGEMLLDLSKLGFEVVGVDISSSMVRQANEIFPQEFPGSSFSVADVENLPFIKESFDLVVCSGVIEYLTRDDLVLREISRLLKDRGIAFVTITNLLALMWFFEDVAKVAGIHSRFVSLIKEGPKFPRARLHVPSVLSHMALAVGLVEIERVYFHFSPFFFPFNEIFPIFSRRIGLTMEVFSKSSLGFMGRGCIIKFVKKVN